MNLGVNNYNINIAYSSGCWCIQTPYPKGKDMDWQMELFNKVKKEIKTAHHRVGLSDKYKYAALYKKGVFQYWFAPEESFKALAYIVQYATDINIKVNFKRDTDAKLEALLAYDKRGELSDNNLKSHLIDGLKSLPDDGQFTAIQFIKDANGRALIGSEPGWGKSITALGYCELTKQKAIIFCPSQRSKTKKNWANEVKKHTHHNPYIMYGSADLDMARLLSSNYVIVNYDIVGFEEVQFILNELIDSGEYTVGIFDESHKLKNEKTERYKDILPFIKKLEKKILLSATSMENKTLDLCTQLHIVAPERFPSRTEFKTKYCGAYIGMTGDGRPKARRQSKAQLEQLRQDIRGIYFYRKLEGTVPLHKQVIRIDNPAAKLLLGDKRVQYDKLIRMMVPHTADATRELLAHTDRKIIVYTGRIEVAEMLAKELGYVACITHGGNPDYPMSSEEADRQFRSFVEDDTKRVMVATYQSFSESINLHHLSNIVLYNDIPMTASKTEQGWGRIKRRGQTEKCYAFFMAFIQTYYDVMIERVEKKAKGQKKVLTNRDTSDSFLNELDTSEGFTKLKQGELFNGTENNRYGFINKAKQER